MNNFIFENSTKVFFGKGCVKEYLSCWAGKFGERVLLAYGGCSIKKNGIYEEVTSILEKAGKTVIEFSGIMANPTYEKVLEGAKIARENEVDWILGIGGVQLWTAAKQYPLLLSVRKISGKNTGQSQELLILNRYLSG